MNTGIVRSLIGQRCWYVSAGGVTWPSFVLVCGDMIARELPLSNPAHPEPFKSNRGSVELLIWCSWRLQTDSRVLASSDEAESGAKALIALVGTTLTEARCSAPAWDLALAFSSGLAIQVFADNHGPEPTASQNWELWVPGMYVRAGVGEAWEEQPG